jgi:hypothetical protein
LRQIGVAPSAERICGGGHGEIELAVRGARAPNNDRFVRGIDDRHLEIAGFEPPIDE